MTAFPFTMPRAYSYIRFSTPEQAKGDSFRRQTEASKKYALEHDLVLDTSLNLFDEGLSGYTGENRKKGALAVFIRAVENGLVPRGSVLLVESLDRLSRDKILEQVSLFTSLVNAGVTVVTLFNNQVLNEAAINKDPLLLMFSIISMWRAHDESAHKSLRVREAWANKRKRATEIKLSAQCPSWLSLRPDRKGFDLIPERVELVRRIYEMNAGGLGQMTIARTLNQEGIPSWSGGKGWHYSYIQRVLRTRAVLGEFQPCYREGDQAIPDGPLLPDYFPAIIPEALWQRVQNRGQTARPGGPLGERVSCLFSGLVFDGYTGTSMRHMSRRSRGGRQQRPRYYYLVSDYARMAKGAKATSWRYDWFEAQFLAFITGLDWAEVAQETAPSEEVQLRSNVAAEQAKLAGIQQQLTRLTEALATTEQAAPQSVLGLIGRLEKEQAKANARLLAVAKEAAAMEARRLALQDSADRIRALVANGNRDARLRLREEIRRRIQRIDVFAEGVPEERFVAEGVPLSAPGSPAFKITFANGASRWVINASRRPDSTPALVDVVDCDEGSESDAGAPEAENQPTPAAPPTLAPAPPAAGRSPQRRPTAAHQPTLL